MYKLNSIADNYDNGRGECKDCFEEARLVNRGRCSGCANMCNSCGEYVDYDLDGDLRCEMCPIELESPLEV